MNHLPQAGRRHRLVLYTYTLNRWLKYMIWTGLLLLALVAAETYLPGFGPSFTPIPLGKSLTEITAGAGIFALFAALFFMILSSSAYTQPFNDHLRLVTPFLRMNISYRRIISATSTEMATLFPPENLREQKRNFLHPLRGQTAIVLLLKGWPLRRQVLSLFLSPFFFPDRTARLALLVPDWIEFSTELDSYRSEWLYSLRHPDGISQSELLASLSRSK